MWFRTLLDSMKPRRSGTPIRRTPRRPTGTRLRVEALEDRCVPALYAVTDLGTLVGSYTTAADLNQAGQVVGTDYTWDHLGRAFLWENGTMIDLGTLGGNVSTAAGINDLGQVVGTSFLPDGATRHAFLVNPQGGVWFQDSDLDGRNDFMIDLGVLNGSFYSVATDVNNAGQVVGESDGQAFLWDAANGMTDLGTPLGFTRSSAAGINEAGQVTGTASYSDSWSQRSAFRWGAVNGMTDLGAGLTYPYSEAVGLNDAGQVVGVSPAFLWTPDWPNGLAGSFTALGVLPGDTENNATAINNSGQVVGTSTLVEYVYYCDHYCDEYGCYDDCYYAPNYYPHAFLWDAAGGMVDLQNQLQPGSDANLSNAQAINDGGSIVANGWIDGRWAVGFLLTPIPPGTPSISIADAAAVTEGNAGMVNVAFTVTLSAASDQIVTVDFTTVAGSAVAGSDFVATAETLTFLPGDVSKSITVQVKGDLLNEATEAFTVNLRNPTNGVIADVQGVGTIVDDDPLPTLAVNDVQVTEGNAGTTNAVFTVSLSAPSGRSVSVYYSTGDGTAWASYDYQSQFGSLNFAPGDTSRTVTVRMYGDTRYEADETFAVNLSNQTNATLADAQGVGTIFNDDPPELVISDVALKESNAGTTNFVFTVAMSAVPDAPVTVDYATGNGTATAGSDYEAASGKLTIPAGQTTGTITVLVYGDRLPEPNKTFFVNLSSPTNATIADNLGVGTIVDDEPRITISDVSKAEGKKGKATLFTFTVTLSTAYDQPVTMSFQTVDGTATTSNNDYVAKTGTLTFAPGETTKTIIIEVKGDIKKEADETFYLDLFGNSSNSLFTKNRGSGTILNDD